MELFFNYKGVNFQIIESDLICEGVTVMSGINADTLLKDVQAECDKYLSFKQERERKLKSIKVTLTRIRQAVKAAGGTYKKCKFYLNGNEAYEVNGKVYPKQQMFDAFLRGDL